MLTNLRDLEVMILENNAQNREIPELVSNSTAGGLFFRECFKQWCGPRSKILDAAKPKAMVENNRSSFLNALLDFRNFVSLERSSNTYTSNVSTRLLATATTKPGKSTGTSPTEKPST